MVDSPALFIVDFLVPDGLELVLVLLVVGERWQCGADRDETLVQVAVLPFIGDFDLALEPRRSHAALHAPHERALRASRAA